MSDLLMLSFFRNALMVSVLLSLMFGMLSFFAVNRKMAFLGAGIAHTAFGGVALGVFLGIQPLFVTLVFCIAAAVAIGKLVRHGNISMDVSIGIFFSFSMAIGVLLITLKKAYTFDLAGYLFGNILAVSTFDLAVVSVCAVIFILFILIHFSKLIFMTFDEPVAQICGVSVRRLDTLLLVSLAAIIVVSIKVVGIILASALVVLPASFGMLWFKTYRRVIAASMLFALFCMTGGIFLSYYLNAPAGATIVTLGSVMYFTGFFIKQIGSK